jgi:hypothetical protein
MYVSTGCEEVHYPRLMEVFKTSRSQLMVGNVVHSLIYHARESVIHLGNMKELRPGTNEELWQHMRLSVGIYLC